MSQRAYKLRGAVATVESAPLAETEPDSPEEVEDDPFRYGWRERREIAPDGSEKLGWIPLTYGDLLDPQEGDRVAENTIHRVVVDSVAGILRRRYEDDPGVAVWCDLKIVFHIPGLTTGPAPDLCVVDGVVDRHRYRKSFHFGDEPGKVRLVVEVVSEESVKKDYRDILAIYAPMGVKEYVAIRPLGFYADGPFELRGWRLDPRTRQLRPIAPNAQGRILSLTTGLLFGTGAEGWGLSLWDAATGERLLSPDEDMALLEERAEQLEERAEQLKERAEQAEEREEQLEERAERAEQRNRELAAEIDRLRAQLQERESNGS